jgi:hypothetical protein
VPVPGPGAFNGHAATMEFYELADDGEAEPESVMCSRRREVGLSESLEDMWQERRTDALARIDDAYLDAAVSTLQCDMQLATSGGNLMAFVSRFRIPVEVGWDRR